MNRYIHGQFCMCSTCKSKYKQEEELKKPSIPDYDYDGVEEDWREKQRRNLLK